MEDEVIIAESRIDGIQKLIKRISSKYYLDKAICKEPPLDTTKEALLSLTVEELHGLRWEFGCYNISIQRSLNEATAFFNWAEYNLKRVCEKESSNYEGFTWQERQANVIIFNEYASRLSELRSQSKLVVDQLSFISQRVEFLSKVAGDITYAKNKEG